MPSKRVYARTASEDEVRTVAHVMWHYAQSQDRTGEPFEDFLEWVESCGTVIRITFGGTGFVRWIVHTNDGVDCFTILEDALTVIDAGSIN